MMGKNYAIYLKLFALSIWIEFKQEINIWTVTSLLFRNEINEFLFCVEYFHLVKHFNKKKYFYKKKW